MATLPLQRSVYRHAVSPHRRAAALALAAGLVGLLILALLRLGVVPPRTTAGGRSLSTFTVLPEGEKREAIRPRQEQKLAAAKSPPTAKPPPIPPPPVPFKAPPGMIILTRDEMASADIDRMPRGAKGAELADAGEDTPSSGGGPGGERLYEAEWYREPPANAMALYLPRGAPAGAWATIACRTVAKYRVDNCRQLDDFPRGQGLSSALRQAAWQFQVRPPRLGGKPLVGAWVRIRFYWNKPADG